MSIQQITPVNASVNIGNKAAPQDIQIEVENDLISVGMNAVEMQMQTIIASDVTVLQEASKHILAAGGKRVRPRLALLVYMACGGQDVQSVAPVAAALELVHTASVVHDDINDHGVVRRGRPSVNAIWGRTFALLTGDFLFTKVYELMAPYQDLNIVLAEATVALVEGETLQAVAVKENRLNRATYFDIIARKTAALFKAGGILGARMAGAAGEVVDAVAQYGYNVGLAFQIIDDILDLTADSDTLGKTSGIDVDQGRGLAVAYSDADEPVKSDPMEIFKQRLLQGDAIQEGRRQAEMLVKSAIQMLDVLPASPERDALEELANLIVSREY